jgi:hypothetical protein
MEYNCRRCHHVEAEHHGLGCVHQTYTELRTDHNDGSVTINTDLSVCGCDYFRGPVTDH